ncbi:cyclase [Micromonospora sp. CPCC 206060]|uniref:SRPBCC family protein n=1 Tax=Micromonospora sp. CPCC 206060 TaxID=3122406 RepID=UPI002FF17F2E
MTSDRTRWTLLATAGVAGAGVAFAARRRRHQPERRDGWYVVHRGVTVDRPVDAVIGFWSDPERLGTALGATATLRQLDGNRWECTAVEPDGDGTQWRAGITVEEPGQLSWRVVDGPVPQEGRIRLVDAPQGRGTEIRIELRYRYGGPVGRMFGLVTGREPDLRLRDVLRRVKALVECGQVLDTRHDPSGRGPVQEWFTDAVRGKLTTGGRA